MKNRSRRKFIKSTAVTLAGLPLIKSVSIGGPSLQSNPIQLENEKPGTWEWQLENQSFEREIEGYASHTSINRGSSIKFYVNARESKYQLEVFRLGWYGGMGGRRMTNPIQLTGTAQTIPQPDPETGLIECQWKVSYTLKVPKRADSTEWCSGIYVAKLTALSSYKQSYIVFVVRDDDRPSTYLFQSSVTTFQAYNAWGGKSLYEFNSTDGRAYKVSFNRPYDDGDGTGQIVTGWAGWELNMLRFLEREGYDVTYCTNVDTHSKSTLLHTHKAFLSVGHDEYWSWQIRQNVERALKNKAVNLAFFTANAAFWQIRFESDSSSQANRTMVCYKDAYLDDPYYYSASTRKYTTVQWRDPIVNRPEDALLGVMYEYYPVNGDLMVENTNHWVYANTGLQDGDRLSGLLGYEADRIFGNAPSSLVRLAHSPLDADGVVGFSDMTIYSLSNGAHVFATGSIQFAWGLDDLYSGIVHPNLVSAPAQQMTKNI
ncbi:MAG TPA: N,N-dimethylformamidase beta subunit family domain-containing protein, partial [Blastocatellia bacterium]|nr:N,N-dimethylformamidase beta subunit family domain-containing protein [Blastocatellia bacterium]